jgi:hypothetical protein
MSTSFGVVEKIAVSPDSQKIAFFNSDGILATATSSLQSSLSESKTKSKVPPTEMMWCGNDAVLLYWNQAPPAVITLISKGNFIKYDCDDENVHFVLECDGVRIISKDRCEFLQQVPKATQNIFEIGSISPAAMLYDATEAFENRSASADDNIRNISNADEMKSAILACVMLSLLFPL